MKLKYRVVQRGAAVFVPQAYTGFWIFGMWRDIHESFDELGKAQSHIIYYANMVAASRDQIACEITFEAKNV